MKRVQADNLGFFAGKDAIANFLKKEEDFTQLHLVPAEYLRKGTPSQSNDQIVQIQDLKRLQKIKSKDHDSRGDLVFDNAESLLDYVTDNWQKNWVTTDVDSVQILELYSRRPFFMLVGVDAPVITRFQRFCQE
jgi:dCMP deaminase